MLFQINFVYIGATIYIIPAIIEIHNCHMRNYVGKTNVQSSALTDTNHVSDSDPGGMCHVQTFYSVCNCVDHTIFFLSV